MARNSGGNRGDVRQSALWGSGNRGGELRSNALWGKGGRGVVVLMLLALSMPLAASAGNGKGDENGKAANAVKSNGVGNNGIKLGIVPVAGTHVDEKVLKRAANTPDKLIRVIVQARQGYETLKSAAGGLGRVKHELDLINGVAMELPAKQVEKLAAMPNLIVTFDEDIHPLGAPVYSSKQLWPVASGVNKLWDGPQAPTIAIVDSGIDTARADFGTRVLEQVNFVSTGKANAPGDGRGHGTFVAGIAAGSAPGYAGAAPNAKLVSLDVMDDGGSGYTSDVIKAAQWILANKDRHNIRVANFSLHSANMSRFYDDPLNVAINKLWFGGVVVVAAAGNYGNADGPSGVPHSPGNNPFVITVGAADLGDNAGIGNDTQAAWSAYGRTPDGFWKPEVCASGRYMVGPVPASSTLAAERASSLKSDGYIELSGTSFAAPVVAGIAAQLLARNPGLSPDQVKGALMESARPVPKAAANSCGVGQVNGVRAATALSAPNPNLALNQFVTTNLLTGGRTFDAVSWSNVSWSNVSWSNVSWSNVSWSNVSWSTVSWSNVSWSNVSWSNVSWSNMTSEDAAEGDVGDGTGYELTPEEAAAAALDPDLLLPGETLPTPEPEADAAADEGAAADDTSAAATADAEADAAEATEPAADADSEPASEGSEG
jgi:serine protease AprX